MAEIHIEEHSSPIKTPKQLVIVVVLAFAVPITLIVMLVQLITGGADLSRNHPGMSQEAIAKRLKPVGELVVDPTQPAPASAPATVAAAAPKAGDKAAWAPRMKAGMSTLYASSIKGKNAIRPRAAISRSATPTSTRRWTTW